MFIIFLIYLAFLCLIFVFQRNLQYFPIGKIYKISSYHLEGFGEETLVGADKTKILAWYKAPKKGEKIILLFHGNAGNLGYRRDKLAALAAENFGVLAVSYRGYSGSEGKPTEAGLIMDGEAAVQFLFDQGFNEKDIILYGESLGAAVAVQIGARNNFAAIILEAPFSSIAAIAQKIYWFIPVRLLLLDKFESEKFVPKISSPILIFHGTADSVVPYSEGQKLFGKIKSQKKFITSEGTGHLGFDDQFLAREVRKFVEEGS